MEGKTNFSRHLKQFYGLTWLNLTPYFTTNLRHWLRGHHVAVRYVYLAPSPVRVSAKTDDAFVSAILSGHYIVACLARTRWSLAISLLRPP